MAVASAIVISMLLPLATRGQVGGDPARRNMSAIDGGTRCARAHLLVAHAFAGVKLVARTASRKMAAGAVLAILATVGLLATGRRRWNAFEVPAPGFGLTCAGQGGRAPPVAGSLP